LGMIFSEDRPPTFRVMPDVELQIKTPELPVKYAEIACESACFSFDGASASLYVERS
jgi:hypothetical protein